MIDWAVERVVFGDGVVDYTGCALWCGILYANGKRQGGNETFWAVCKGSFKVWDRQEPAEKIRLELEMA